MRVLTGLHFDGVLKVQSQNVRQDDPDAVAELLAINFTHASDGSNVEPSVCAPCRCISKAH